MTHFVTPSPVWPATPQDKQDIIQAYRSKLATLDCKHFNFGNGSCPFGTSCHYRHVDRAGRLQQRGVRHILHDEGAEGVSIVRDVKLADFLDGI